jgi:hypothetical protein
MLEAMAAVREPDAEQDEAADGSDGPGNERGAAHHVAFGASFSTAGPWIT